MSLDVFQEDQRRILDDARRRAAPELPLGFTDTYLPAWTQGTQVAASISATNARMAAMEEFLDDVYKRTGKRLPNPMVGAPFDTTGAPTGGGDLAALNAALEPLAMEFPALGRLRQQGVEVGFQPLTEGEIDQMAVVKAQKVQHDYQNTLQRERTFGGSLGVFTGAAASSFSDPINIVALPLGAPEALGIIRTTLAWGGIASGSQLAIEVINAPFREQVQPGYAISGEAVGNIVETGLFGGALGGGLKGISNAWTRVKTGAWPRTIRDAGNVVESENQIATTNVFPGIEGEGAHRNALSKAIDDSLGIRPVNVDEHITPPILAAYEQRLAPIMQARQDALTASERRLALERESARLPPSVERLSEQQLDQIRQTAVRIEQDAQVATGRVAQETAAIAAEREAAAGARATAGAATTEATNLRAELSAARQRLSEARPPTDPATEARLAAIETDLARATLGRDARALLETEKASITETLAKTAPGDRKLIGSLEQEVKGLEKALARSEKAAARGEGAAVRRETKADAQERRTGVLAERAQERAGSRREALQGEMRRAVTALANDGYGLRIPRSDAETIADSILRASDEEAPAVISGVTDRFIQLRQNELSAGGAVAQRDMLRAAELAAREEALTGRQITTEAQRDQLRIAEETGKQAVAAQNAFVEARDWIRRLAREMGVEMPPGHAADIATYVLAVSEREALAVLDELMLRPRTLADTLPGSSRLAEARAARADAPPQMALPGTDTADFQRFFQDSRAVDAEGKPMPMFHGTEDDFTRFAAEKTGRATGAADARHGFFFASNIETARSYAPGYNPYREGGGMAAFLERISGGFYSRANEYLIEKLGMKSAIKEGRVLTTYLSVKNPLEISANGRHMEGDEMLLLVNRAKQEGHDGLVIRQTKDEGFTEGQGGDGITDVWVAFNSDQIHIAKSERTATATPPVPTSIPRGPGKLQSEAVDPRGIFPGREAPSFERTAAAVEKGLPPVKDGFTRLWRGNRPDEIGQATEFTSDLTGIALPFRQHYGGEISYVDVPHADLGKYMQRSGSAPEAEFVVPDKVAKTAKQVDTARVEPTTTTRSALEEPVRRPDLDPVTMRLMAEATTPDAVAKLRTGPAREAVMDAAIAAADRERANKDIQVATGEVRVEPDGSKVAVMVSLDEAMAKQDARIKAAEEIAACASPQQVAAE